MIIYHDNLRSLSLLTRFMASMNLRRRLIFIMRVLFSKKKRIKNPDRIVGYSYKRSEGNRIYWITKMNSDIFFSKTAEGDLVPLDWKPWIRGKNPSVGLNRKAFEQLGYGLTSTIYHGDMSRENILISDGQVNLIDWESAGHYSLEYQNFDYLINYYGVRRYCILSYDSALALHSLYNLNWEETFRECVEMRISKGCSYIQVHRI